jgi:cell division protein FtsL
MLNRTSLLWSSLSTVTLSWRRILLTEPISQLLRYILGLMLLCAVACLYLWQTTTVSTIRQHTASLRREAIRLEEENVALMLQVATWDSPARVAKEAAALGMVPSTGLVYARLPAGGDPVGSKPTSGQPGSAPTDRPVSPPAAWWRDLSSRLMAWLESGIGIHLALARQ